MIKVYQNIDEALVDIESSGERMDLMLEFINGPVFGKKRELYLEELP